MFNAEAVTTLRQAAATPEVLSLLTRELNRIHYGSILLAVHDGKVVQFDVTEKRRIT